MREKERENSKGVKGKDFPRDASLSRATVGNYGQPKGSTIRYKQSMHEKISSFYFTSFSDYAKEFDLQKVL